MAEKPGISTDIEETRRANAEAAEAIAKATEAAKKKQSTNPTPKATSTTNNPPVTPSASSNPGATGAGMSGTVPPAPPSGGGGGSSGGTSSGKSFYQENKILCTIIFSVLIMIALSFIANLMINYFERDRVKTLKQSIPVLRENIELQKKMAEIKSEKGQSTTEAGTLVMGRMLDCSTPQQRDLTLATAEVEVINTGQVLHALPGCMLAKFNHKVMSVSGEKFHIVFDAGPGAYIQCGNQSHGNNDMPSACVSVINRYSGHRFRIFVQSTGYLNIQ